ncbi:efflux RND transporter permease subunit [Sphingomonas sp. MMS24-JH45]
MKEITVALVAIALVLSAVFLPMAFFGGSTGVIYRQFSITVVSAMILSVLVAVILSPALTTTLLKKHNDENGDAIEHSWLARKAPKVAHGLQRAKKDWFNDAFDRMVARYIAWTRYVIDRKVIFLLIYVGTVALLAFLFLRMPTGSSRPRTRDRCRSSSSFPAARRRTAPSRCSSGSRNIWPRTSAPTSASCW